MAQFTFLCLMPTHILRSIYTTIKIAFGIIRASDSITLNIAEGYSSTKPNFNKYLQIAWDSANECVVCSTKARRRGFIDFKTDENNRKLITELSKMISSDKEFLRNS